MVTTSKVDQMMRRLIKAVVAGQPLGDYSTIEDATLIDEIKKAAENLRKSKNACARASHHNYDIPCI